MSGQVHRCQGAIRGTWGGDRQCAETQRRAGAYDELLSALKSAISEAGCANGDGWMSGGMRSEDHNTAQVLIAKLESEEIKP